MINLLSSLFGSSKYQSLSGQEFKSQYKAENGAVLLDVRTPGEFASGSIQGAKNIDFTAGSFKSNISKLDKDKTYYLFVEVALGAALPVAL